MWQNIDAEAAREGAAIRDNMEYSSCPRHKTRAKQEPRYAIQLKSGRVLEGFFVKKGPRAVFRDHEYGDFCIVAEDIEHIAIA